MSLKYCLVTALVLLLGLFGQSCKKGCTNPTALNYVRSAKVDDASCLYCDSVLITGNNSNQIAVADFNSASPYFEQNVIQLIVSNNFVQYNGNGCQLLGHTNNSATGTVSTYYTASISNETSSTVVFTGTIQIGVFLSGSGEVFFDYSVSNVSIPPSGTTTVKLGSGGQQSEFNSFSLQVVSPSFTYH